MIELTKIKVKRIIKLYATGRYTQQKLANFYGVHQSLISYIIDKKRWYFS